MKVAVAFPYENVQNLNELEFIVDNYEIKNGGEIDE
jgi:hypothetical protein